MPVPVTRFGKEQWLLEFSSRLSNRFSFSKVISSSVNCPVSYVTRYRGPSLLLLLFKALFLWCWWWKGKWQCYFSIIICIIICSLFSSLDRQHLILNWISTKLYKIPSSCQHGIYFSINKALEWVTWKSLFDRSDFFFWASHCDVQVISPLSLMHISTIYISIVFPVKYCTANHVTMKILFGD